jgi:hypothetical protein
MHADRAISLYILWFSWIQIWKTSVPYQ